MTALCDILKIRPWENGRKDHVGREAMKKKRKALALFTAFAVGVASVIPFRTATPVSAAQATYESGKVYDATEAYFKV